MSAIAKRHVAGFQSGISVTPIAALPSYVPRARGSSASWTFTRTPSPCASLPKPMWSAWAWVTMIASTSSGPNPIWASPATSLGHSFEHPASITVALPPSVTT